MLFECVPESSADAPFRFNDRFHCPGLIHSFCQGPEDRESSLIQTAHNLLSCVALLNYAKKVFRRILVNYLF